MELAPDKLQLKLEECGFKIDSVADEKYAEGSWNKAPQSYSMIYCVNNKTTQLAGMKWTLQPSYAKSPVEYASFNTRSESLNPLKPAWKSAVTHRGILFMRGYYEWHTSNHQPHYISSSDDLMFCLVIWDSNPTLVKVPTFSVVTTAASAELKDIHPRMPVVVSKELAQEWVHGKWPDVLKVIQSNSHLKSKVVSKEVNKVGTNKRELTFPVKVHVEPKITDFFSSKTSSKHRTESAENNHREKKIRKLNESPLGRDADVNQTEASEDKGTNNSHRSEDPASMDQQDK